MANKNPKHKFPHGHKFGGRKPLPEDIKQARNMSYEEMCRTIIEVRQLTLKKLKTINMSLIPLGKRVIINAYEKLDYNCIKNYEDRLFGKATENVNANIDYHPPVVLQISEKFLTSDDTTD